MALRLPGGVIWSLGSTVSPRMGPQLLISQEPTAQKHKYSSFEGQYKEHCLVFWGVLKQVVNLKPYRTDLTKCTSPQAAVSEFLISRADFLA